MDFLSKLAVKSTEVAVSSFAVESDFSLIMESAVELHQGEVAVGDEETQKAVADGSALAASCHWRCNYCCC